MTCIILQDGSGSAEDQPRVAEHYSGSGGGPLDRRRSSLRTHLDMRRSSLRTLLRYREGGGLGRATTLLLLRSLQIKSLDRLLNHSVRGDHFLYSQSIMVIHANTNCCTHLSCLQLMGRHHVIGHMP
jgi:hypothetical protein